MPSALGGPLYSSVISLASHPSWPPWLWWMHCFGPSLVQKGPWSISSSLQPQTSSFITRVWSRRAEIAPRFNNYLFVHVGLIVCVYLNTSISSVSAHARSHNTSGKRNRALWETRAQPCRDYPNFLNAASSIFRASKPSFQGFHVMVLVCRWSLEQVCLLRDAATPSLHPSIIVALASSAGEGTIMTSFLTWKGGEVSLMEQFLSLFFIIVITVKHRQKCKYWAFLFCLV